MQSDAALAQRIRNAAITVAASIATSQQGSAPRSRRALHGASVALGELGYYLHFARRVGLIGETDLRRIATLEGEVGRHLDALLNGTANPQSENASAM